MTLQEAVLSGKRFARGDGGEYHSTEDWLGSLDVDDIVATDYVLEPDATVTITKGEFRETWDNVAALSTSVKPSHASPLYAKLVAALFE
jgi:hypothetical protein